LEIRILTEGGSVETFVQDHPAVVARILKGIQPAKLFAADVITIAGEYSLTSFNCSRVNRVDFVTKDFALWNYPTDILDIVELSESEFRQRSHLNEPARLEKRRNPKAPGEFAVVFVEVEMTGGNRTFLAAEIAVPVAAERLQRLHRLFSAPAFHFRLPEGGAAVLNVKNLVRFTFNPGPDVTPLYAWPAHHLPARQGADSNRSIVSA
jgi:hypothetical protein